jgi:hypothetical protein
MSSSRTCAKEKKRIHCERGLNAFGCTYYFVEEIQDCVWEEFISQEGTSLDDYLVNENGTEPYSSGRAYIIFILGCLK